VLFTRGLLLSVWPDGSSCFIPLFADRPPFFLRRHDDDRIEGSVFPGGFLVSVGLGGAPLPSFS